MIETNQRAKKWQHPRSCFPDFQTLDQKLSRRTDLSIYIFIPFLSTGPVRLVCLHSPLIITHKVHVLTV